MIWEKKKGLCCCQPLRFLELFVTTALFSPSWLIQPLNLSMDAGASMDPRSSIPNLKILKSFWKFMSLWGELNNTISESWITWIPTLVHTECSFRWIEYFTLGLSNKIHDCEGDWNERLTWPSFKREWRVDCSLIRGSACRRKVRDYSSPWCAVDAPWLRCNVQKKRIKKTNVNIFLKASND